MGHTITEKIIARVSGKDSVSPGEIVTVRVDAVIGHDTSVAAFRVLRDWGVDQVFDREKVYITVDHFVPSPTQNAALQYRDLSRFMQEYGIVHWFPAGKGGICHALFPERGLIRPGMLVVGSDSHTCTYGAVGAFSAGMGATDTAAAMALGETWLKVPESIRMRYEGALPPRVGGKDLVLHTMGVLGVEGALYKAIEFDGEAIHALDMDARFTICNMAVEAGAKNGIIAPDAVTEAYVRARTDKPYLCHASDADAQYCREHVCDASTIPPLVAKPFSPGNIAPVQDIHGVKVDQVVIGSCTNGRIQDLRDAASLLKDRKIASHVRMLIIPATQRVYMQAIREGLVECFIRAGGLVVPPTCGPCFGGHMGLLAEGETAVSTTNRNFVSRMGHKDSRVYLASPMTAAASALAGELMDPRFI